MTRAGHYLEDMTTTSDTFTRETYDAATLFSAYWRSRDEEHVSEELFIQTLMAMPTADIVAEVVEMYPHLDTDTALTPAVLAELPGWIDHWKATVTRIDSNRKPTEDDIAEAIERSIREIIADINDGVLPWDVNHFSVLHDYVDANTYGGLCDEAPINWSYDPELGDAGMDPGQRVQDAVHDWLTYRAQRLGIAEHIYTPEFGSGSRYGGVRIATPTDDSLI